MRQGGILYFVPTILDFGIVSFFSSRPHQILPESWHISNVQVLFPKLLIIIIARSETMLCVWVIFDENIRAYSCENCCGVLFCKWIEHKIICTNLVIHIAGYVVYARPIYPWQGSSKTFLTHCHKLFPS